MEENFNYNQIPQTYTHCLHATCPRSAGCLRFQVALHASPERAVFEVINPVYVAGNEENCRFFQPDKLSRFAQGITHLLDNIPYAQAVRIQNALSERFQRTTLFRIRAKGRLITPAEQESIRKIFQKEGIAEEPVFDRYVFQYKWD